MLDVRDATVPRHGRLPKLNERGATHLEVMCQCDLAVKQKVVFL